MQTTAEWISYFCVVCACAGLLLVVWKTNEARGLSLWKRKNTEDWNVFTPIKEDADYWQGKEGSPATDEIKRRIYILYRSKCQKCKCGVIVGNATTTIEHIKAAFRGFKPGNVHHRVPAAWGGTARVKDGKPTLDKDGKLDFEMFILLCQECNLEISDDVRDPWTIEFCKKRRLKIFITKPFEL